MEIQSDPEILPQSVQEPLILADVIIETLAIDGICGVY